MSRIRIENIGCVGSELLFDSESYLSELEEEELILVEGGFPTATHTLATSTYCVAVQISVKTPNAYRFSYNVSYNLGKRFK